MKQWESYCAGCTRKKSRATQKLLHHSPNFASSHHFERLLELAKSMLDLFSQYKEYQGTAEKDIYVGLHVLLAKLCI